MEGARRELVVMGFRMMANLPQVGSWLMIGHYVGMIWPTNHDLKKMFLRGPRFPGGVGHPMA